ncbi:hypothetical protein OS493_029420 [Desmophyllum pertusum]|uniref:Uncharacterized protein n=1 Tax=Desmophyllum pertusum TaxID=174260 RepID=A0A9X0CIX6_9CNID|nr:hypothetical protein OS493_029420 [Desmophyllum pertusum]
MESHSDDPALATKTTDERNTDTKIHDDRTKTESAPFTARNSERLRRRVLINDERARQQQLINQFWIRLKNSVYHNCRSWRDARILMLRVFAVFFLYFLGKYWIIWQREVLKGLDARWERERQEDIRLRQERLARRPVPERRPKNRQNKRHPRP